MKKIELFLLVSFVLVGLCSCKPDTSEDDEEKSGLPSIAISDIVVRESYLGGEGRDGSTEVPSRAEIRFKLSKPAQKEATFLWSTGNKTAEANKDYRPVVSGQMIVRVGQQSGVLEVNLLNDSLNEDDEVFTINITKASLERITSKGSTLTSEVTIEDEDPESSISIGDVSVDEDVGVIEIPYELSASTGKKASFSWNVTGGTASSAQNSDYTLPSSGNRKVVLEKGSSSTGVIRITLADDSVYEGTETIEISLDADSIEGLSLPDEESEMVATVTIRDNDFPSIRILGSTFSGSEGSGEILITYALSTANTFHDVSFSWAAERVTTPSSGKGAAVESYDYLSSGEKVTLLAGASGAKGVFRIPINDDNFDELDEEFVVKIDGDSLVGLEAGTTLQTTVTIVDDDRSPRMDIFDTTVGEDEGKARVVYELSAPSGREITFSWRTRTLGTTPELTRAESGVDYTAVASTEVTIAPGFTQGVLLVPIIDDDDTEVEGGETFRVEIDRTSLDEEEVTVVGSNFFATVTILDRPFLRIQDIRVDENDGTAYIPYYLSSPSSVAVTFNWSTSEGTATTADYTGQTSTSESITSGNVEGVLEVAITDNAIFEGNQSFTVTLSGLTGVESSDNDLVAEVTIVDDEDIDCPSNYVKVPSFKGYTSGSFCVAKYEMKDDGSGSAISSLGGRPWVGISRDNAISECSGVSIDRFTTDLINNDQWQSLARNIEFVSSNWDRGVVGSSGGLSRGHSDGYPSAPLPAHSNDNESCYRTGQDCSLGAWSSQRRTHELFNGEVIWDIAGNAWEWVKDDNSLSYGEDSYLSRVTRLTHDSLNALSEGTKVPRSVKIQFGPRGAYTVQKSGNFAGLGYGYLGIEAIELAEDDETVDLNRYVGIVRGGGLSDGVKAGVFAVDLGVDINEISEGVNGFRCVAVPVP